MVYPIFLKLLELYIYFVSLLRVLRAQTFSQALDELMEGVEFLLLGGVGGWGPEGTAAHIADCV